MPSLLVTNDFPPKHGGIQSYLYELWRRLPPGETTVLTTSFPGAASWDAQQSFRIDRVRQRVLLPTPAVARRVDALAARGRSRRDLPRSDAAARADRAAVEGRAVRRRGARERDHRIRTNAGEQAAGAARHAQRRGRGRRGFLPGRRRGRSGRSIPRRRVDPAGRGRRALPSGRRRGARRDPPPLRPRSRTAARAGRVAARPAQGLRRRDRRDVRRPWRRAGRRAARDRGSRPRPSQARAARAWRACSSSGGSPTPISRVSTCAPTCSRCAAGIVGGGSRPRGSASCSSRLRPAGCRRSPAAAVARTRRSPTARRGTSWRPATSMRCAMRSGAS